MWYRASLKLLLAICLSFSVLDAVSAHLPPKNPYPQGGLPDPSKPLEVNLGYAGYAGVHNAISGLNRWNGYVKSFQKEDLVIFLRRLILERIRYAQAPLGDLRWQASVPPRTKFNGTFLDASTYGPTCPQAPDHIM